MTHRKPPDDRRVERTLGALHDAFTELVLDRRYAEIKVGDIVESAEVGRSTFYEHFRGKDDLLVQSMAWMFERMAAAGFDDGDPAALEAMLDHMWENRQLAHHLFRGEASRELYPRFTRELEGRIEERLESRIAAHGVTALIPVRLIAVQVAEAQFGLLRAWLTGEASCSASNLALALRRGTVGAVTAMLQTAPGADAS